MKAKVLFAIVSAGFSVLLCGCGLRVSRSLDEIDGMLRDRPAEAFARIDSIDPSSLSARLLARHTLLRAIALDKNNIDDGSFVSEMEKAAEWYDRHANCKDRLRSDYYYGDQLRDAGRQEDAAVRFMLSEEEAVRLEDWFLAGMSARSLYQVFLKTFNHPEELSSINRAVGYFKKAGLSAHEDDARIKLGIALYDSGLYEQADSVFNSAIGIATSKNDTTRLRLALANSVNPMLMDGHFRPDTVISRLNRATGLGFKMNGRVYSDYALSNALNGDMLQAERYLALAYGACSLEVDRVFVTARELQIRKVQNDISSAFKLLDQLNAYSDSVTVKTLEQSVVKAQKNALSSANERLAREKILGARVSKLLISLLASLLIIALLLYKSKSDRLRAEEENYRLFMDECKLAYKELGSIDLDNIKRVLEVVYRETNMSEDCITSAEFRKEIKRILSEDGFRNRLMSYIDQAHSGVVSRLRLQVPNLTESQVSLFAYLAQGFSYTTILVLTGKRSRQNVYDSRQRLVKEIEETDPEDRDEFLRYLANRPTRVKNITISPGK